MPQPLETQLANAEQRLRKQQLWMINHGGGEAGYVARYGSAKDPEHYGAGGEAIWAADYAKLVICWQERNRIAERIARRNRRRSLRAED